LEEWAALANTWVGRWGGSGRKSLPFGKGVWATTPENVQDFKCHLAFAHSTSQKCTFALKW